VPFDQRVGFDEDEEATPFDQTGQSHQRDPPRIVRAPRLYLAFEIERQLLAKN
jgi:hypothetical protein